jgi:GNAT superfamily N-acetyltransferase
MIRSAGPRDTEYIAACFAALATHLRATTGHPFASALPTDPAASIALAGSFVDSEDGFALIAESEGEPVGCLAARVGPASVGWWTREVGQIACCWVEPARRRGGVGRALVAEAEAELGRRGVDHVELAYLAGNAEAEAAWSRLGYEPHRVFALKPLDAGSRQGP